MTRVETIRQKLRKELKEFEDKCIENGVKYTLMNAYEYIIKKELLFRYDEYMEDDEILEALDGERSSEYVYKYILEHDNALDYMYDCWIDSDANIGETLTDTIDYCMERAMGD